MLTVDEILSDVGESPGFEGIENITVSTRGRNGETPLHWMAVLGDDKATLMLLSAGANINEQDDDGNSPLHVAVDGRQHTVVRCLIEAGADTRAVNKAGLTARDIALRDKNQNVIALFCS